jgi:hypothetical protein
MSQRAREFVRSDTLSAFQGGAEKREDRKVSMRTSTLFSLALASLIALSTGSPSRAAGFDDDYDRLDGHGRSGKKVNVIEWEGNLEIHVYPGGSTKSLALKIDDRDPAKKVMVIGYRFHSNPGQQLVRRNVLGIPMASGFKVYRDPRSGTEYDKFVISNSAAGSPLVAYQTEPGPSQLYPEGHDAVAEKKRAEPETRQPASRTEGLVGGSTDEDSGTIRSRNW